MHFRAHEPLVTRVRLVIYELALDGYGAYCFSCLAFAMRRPEFPRVNQDRMRDVRWQHAQERLDVQCRVACGYGTEIFIVRHRELSPARARENNLMLSRSRASESFVSMHLVQ